MDLGKDQRIKSSSTFLPVRGFQRELEVLYYKSLPLPAALTHHCRESEFSTRAFQTKSLRFPLGCDPRTAKLHPPINQHKSLCLFFCTPGILPYSRVLKFGSEAWLSSSGNVDYSPRDFSQLNLDQFRLGTGLIRSLYSLSH